MQQQGNVLPTLDFEGDEERNGIRFSWNYWPSSRLEGQRLVVPIGAIYTPLKKVENFHQVAYEPVKCRGCDGILNPNW